MSATASPPRPSPAPDPRPPARACVRERDARACGVHRCNGCRATPRIRTPSIGASPRIHCIHEHPGRPLTRDAPVTRQRHPTNLSPGAPPTSRTAHRRTRPTRTRSPMQWMPRDTPHPTPTHRRVTPNPLHPRTPSAQPPPHLSPAPRDAPERSPPTHPLHPHPSTDAMDAARHPASRPRPPARHPKSVASVNARPHGRSPRRRAPGASFGTGEVRPCSPGGAGTA